MDPVIKQVVEPVTLGEGPHWDETQQCLFFISIHDQTINKYVPESGQHTKTHLDAKPGFLVPVESKKDLFVLGLTNKILLINWDGTNDSEMKVIKELAKVECVGLGRINDGKCDPFGRLYAGTLSNKIGNWQYERGQGNIYMIEGSQPCKKMWGNLDLANGLAWDLKQKAFYIIDSYKYCVVGFDYDSDTGKISNERTVFDFQKHALPGYPDGMTIDTDGNLWIAAFNGSAILNVNAKTGELIRKVPIPALQVTSATFGGPNYDVLFVTTAKVKAEEEQLPPCGATFMVTGLGVKGHPNVPFKMS